jgi:phage terminase small subunit
MRTHRTNNHRPKERKETTRHNYGRGKKAICQLANGKAPNHLGMTAEHYKKG